MLLWYNISFIKRILKRLCCYRRNEGLIIIIVKFRVETFFTGFCYAPSIHLRGTLYLAQKWLAMLIWKWKGLHIWFMISEKSITRCTFLHCSVHINQKFQQVMKKILSQNFHFFQPFTFMWTSGFYWYERGYTYREAGTSKHSWKKIMQLLWKIVTYLLKKSWTWNWTWYWQCLWSLQTLDIPEIYSRFNEYLGN